MHKAQVSRPAITLTGLTTRTNNRDEMNPQTSKIASLADHYWSGGLAENFVKRINPGVTYSVYTEYESDETGDYTYFIGEEVSDLGAQDQNQFIPLAIPASRYQKFTTAPGQMPEVVIKAWQAIWQIDSSHFGGERRYFADFEVYDHRASDPAHAVVDIYIGIVS